MKPLKEIDLFLPDYISMRDLGILFGVSSHQIGRWLLALGLRVPDEETTRSYKPSEKAWERELVKPLRRVRNGSYFYVWHAARTIRLLQQASHKLADGLPQDVTFV